LEVRVGVQALVASALGLQPPWVIEVVRLDEPAQRINFKVQLLWRSAESPGALHRIAAGS
jgi:hypothetical protein